MKHLNQSAKPTLCLSDTRWALGGPCSPPPLLAQRCHIVQLPRHFGKGTAAPKHQAPARCKTPLL